VGGKDACPTVFTLEGNNQDEDLTWRQKKLWPQEVRTNWGGKGMENWVKINFPPGGKRKEDMTKNLGEKGGWNHTEKPGESAQQKEEEGIYGAAKT